MKMVVSSFSKTLINSEEAISYSTMVEIDRVRNNGIVFSIMTCESLRRVFEYNKDFPFMDYIVSFNGAVVYDVINKNFLYKKNISNSTVKKIYKLFNNYDLGFYNLEYCGYFGNYYDKYNGKLEDDFNKYLLNNKDNVYKIEVICKTKNDVSNVLDTINNLEILVNTRVVEKDNLFFVEIYNKVVNKLVGLKKISNLLNIKMKDIIGIGCSLSDTCVLEKVGKSIAIGNACKEIKSISKEVVGTNEEKGVQEVLKKYL